MCKKLRAVPAREHKNRKPARHANKKNNARRKNGTEWMSGHNRHCRGTDSEQEQQQHRHQQPGRMRGAICHFLGQVSRQRATDWIENKGQVDGRAMSQDWCDELHKCRKASGNGSEWRRCWDCWHCAAEVVKAKGPKWPTLYHICICSVGAETLPRPVASTVIPWPTFTHWHVLFEKEVSLFCNRMIYYRNLEEEKTPSNNGKCLARVLFQALTLIWALLSASHLTQ